MRACMGSGIDEVNIFNLGKFSSGWNLRTWEQSASACFAIPENIPKNHMYMSVFCSECNSISCNSSAFYFLVINLFG